jgi:hypothetical protein
MALYKKSDSAAGKKDAIHIAIFSAIAATIGIYLIATTVLIAGDGLRYLAQAQKFSTNIVDAIKGEPFKGEPCGYSFLIYAAHKLAAMLGGGTSAYSYSWMYSAQAVNLLCRLAAMVILYYIGRLLVGVKQSFWAVLILAVLPYPAELGSDILRDWPHILFLAAGFLALLVAAKEGKWWMFGLAGLAAGLGHTIRPECAQLVIYGSLWLMIGLLLPNRGMSRTKFVCALAILITGFVVPTAPYMIIRGKILPTKVKELFNPSQTQPPDESRGHNHHDDGIQTQTATAIPSSIAKAFGHLFRRISENLMYFFVPPLVIGLYYRFRRPNQATTEKFFIAVFIILNVTMMILLHYNYGYISRRHCLPLVALTIFYVPAGLSILADWLRRGLFKSQSEAKKTSQLFIVLLIIGVSICLPKLLRPIRIEKQGYRDVSRWLNANTSMQDIIDATDSRITFYAQRQVATESQPDKANYAIRTVKNVEDEDEKPLGNWQRVYSATLKKNLKLVVYKKII